MCAYTSLSLQGWKQPATIARTSALISTQRSRSRRRDCPHGWGERQSSRQGPFARFAETQQALGAWKQKCSEWTLTALSHRTVMKERQSSGGLGHRLFHWATSDSAARRPVVVLKLVALETAVGRSDLRGPGRGSS
jgi:hypothetical protein